MEKKQVQLFHATRLENIPSIMKYGLLTSSTEGVTYFTDNPIASWQWMIFKYMIFGENINFNFGIVQVETDLDDSSLSKASDHSNLIHSILQTNEFNVFEYSSNLNPENLRYFHIFCDKDLGYGVKEFQNCFTPEKNELGCLVNPNDFEKMLLSGLSVIQV